MSSRSTSAWVRWYASISAACRRDCRPSRPSSPIATITNVTRTSIRLVPRSECLRKGGLYFCHFSAGVLFPRLSRVSTPSVAWPAIGVNVMTNEGGAAGRHHLPGVNGLTSGEAHSRLPSARRCLRKRDW